MSEANVAVTEFVLRLDSIIRIGGEAPKELNNEHDDCEKITITKCSC